MAAPSKGLGRGLQSLLSTQARPTSKPDAGAIAIEAIRPGPSQPRKTLRKESLEELAASIKAQGVIQPIVVRPIAGSATYEIVAGERLRISRLDVTAMTNGAVTAACCVSCSRSAAHASPEVKLGLERVAVHRPIEMPGAKEEYGCDAL